MYDGFISYSHAADDLLAPRLQAGLQRFAKPWWRRRAVRIFRDESSLAANPHLWSSITEALDDSSWFILLLSHDAAHSEWVGKEIEHWVANKPADRILPVVTDGEFTWENGDVAGSSVHPALRGVFSEEPRWVDLRFARGDEHLDLQNPDFSAAVADVASAIRGIPKDELASEEVRQHRRTVRTAWAAGILVTILGIAAVGFAIQSARNANEAERQAAAAASSAEEAESNAALAESNAADARANAEEADLQAEAARQGEERADRQAAVAQSAAWAAAAANSLEEDPELAALLSILSIRHLPDGEPPLIESVRTLRVADQAHRLKHRVEVYDRDSRMRVDLTRDGTTAYYISTVGDTLGAIDIQTGAQLWKRSFDDSVFNPIEMAVSPDGATLAVMMWELDKEPHELWILSAATGETDAVLPQPCGSVQYNFWLANPFSADGNAFAFPTGTASCASEADQSWISFLDTSDWSEIGRLSAPGVFERVGFAAEANLFVLGDLGLGPLEVRSWPSLDVVQRFEDVDGTRVAISPDGERVAFTQASTPRFGLFDVASGEFLGYAEGQDTFTRIPEFSPDGEILAIPTRRQDVLVSGFDGALSLRIGADDITDDLAFSADGSTLVSAQQSGSILIWNLSRDLQSGRRLGSAIHVQPDRGLDGPEAAVLVIGGAWDSFEFELVVGVSEEQKVIGAIDAAQLPNGEFVVSGAEPVHDEDGNVVHIAFSGLRIVDPASGESRVVTECDLLDTGSGPGVTCEDGEPPFGIVCCHTWLLASPDGAFFAASSTATSADFDGTRLIRVWDTATLEVVRTIEVPRAFELSGLGDSWVSVTKDGSTAAKVFDLDEGKLIAEVAWEDRPTMSEGARFEVTSDGSHVLSPVWESFVIYETGSWTEVARWQGHDALIRGFSLSDDETRLATTAEDGTVRVWDVSSILDSGSTAESRPPLLDEIPTEVASDVRWMSNSELGLAIRSGSWRTVSLDTDELVRHVWSRLTRSFTAGECQSFRIDPCPSLDELREG